MMVGIGDSGASVASTLSSVGVGGNVPIAGSGVSVACAPSSVGVGNNVSIAGSGVFAACSGVAVGFVTVLGLESNSGPSDEGSHPLAITITKANNNIRRIVMYFVIFPHLSGRFFKYHGTPQRLSRGRGRRPFPAAGRSIHGKRQASYKEELNAPPSGTGTGEGESHSCWHCAPNGRRHPFNQRKE
jgi:hypothetical protein